MTDKAYADATSKEAYDDGSGYRDLPFVRILDTDVLEHMADEVEWTNRTKGWYDVHPGVQEFEQYLDELGIQGGYLRMSLVQFVTDKFGDRTFGDDVALLHSEVSEMLEAFRDGGLADQTQPLEEVEYADARAEGRKASAKPEGVGAEAADVLVRLLDTCRRHDINLFAEWRRKVYHNQTRPARHGGKRL